MLNLPEAHATLKLRQTDIFFHIILYFHQHLNQLTEAYMILFFDLFDSEIKKIKKLCNYECNRVKNVLRVFWILTGKFRLDLKCKKVPNY